MSEFKKCTACKGSGFKGRSRTVICPLCHGGGHLKKRQRGHHTGNDTTRRKSSENSNLCPSGHIKKGVSVSGEGKLIPYCEICHRDVVAKNLEKKKRGIPTNI